MPQVLEVRAEERVNPAVLALGANSRLQSHSTGYGKQTVAASRRSLETLLALSDYLSSSTARISLAYLTGSPYSFSPGFESWHINTKRMIGPTSGTKLMKYHAPLRSMSCSLRTVTARLGTKIARIQSRYKTPKVPSKASSSAAAKIVRPRNRAANQYSDRRARPLKFA